MTEHTPLPWHHKQLIKDMWTIIGDWDGKHGQGLATTVGLLEPTDQANAALIVRSVNAAPGLAEKGLQLLDALRANGEAIVRGSGKGENSQEAITLLLSFVAIEGAKDELSQALIDWNK